VGSKKPRIPKELQDAVQIGFEITFQVPYLARRDSQQLRPRICRMIVFCLYCFKTKL